MSTSSIPLLLSLKPHYADLVFRGQKKVELRRRSLKQMQGRDVFVYSTTPVRMLRGGFRIGKVWTGTPEEIWPLVSDSVGVEKPELTPITLDGIWHPLCKLRMFGSMSIPWN